VIRYRFFFFFSFFFFSLAICCAIIIHFANEQKIPPEGDSLISDLAGFFFLFC
jgi:hypothetical protein